MASPLTGDDLPGESLAALAVRRRTETRVGAAEAGVRALLDAGLELMRENPASSPRITDIVRRAKVSNETFYRAFRGKDDLMAAIGDDGARRLLSYVRHQRDKCTEPVAQLEACIVATFKQAADPDVAASTRVVLGYMRRAGTGSAGGVVLRERLAALCVEQLAAIGSPDPERDALFAACSMLAVMEHFVWAERIPTAADVDHLLGRIVPPGTIPGDGYPR